VRLCWNASHREQGSRGGVSFRMACKGQPPVSYARMSGAARHRLELALVWRTLRLICGGRCGSHVRCRILAVLLER
jgi:hypothetical protein